MHTDITSAGPKGIKEKQFCACSKFFGCLFLIEPSILNIANKSAKDIKRPIQKFENLYEMEQPRKSFGREIEFV